MHRSFPRFAAPRRLTICLALALGCTLTGCGTAPPPSSESGRTAPAGNSVRNPAAPERWPQGADQAGLTREDCRLTTGPVLPGGAFVFALLDSVRPHLAPVPRNRDERLVFAQLYETLVRVDCEGTLWPGLAAHWECGADSTVWIFTLRDEARTWDGERLTAVDVWRSWQENVAAPVDDGASPWNWFDPRTGSVSVLDAHRLTVRLPEPQRMFPLLLAHPATAVAVRRPGWVWPLGSGPCRLARTDGAPRPGLTCRPNPDHPRRPVWESLTFRVTPGRSPAALADAADACDLLWTRDLNAAHRFGNLPAWRVQALPWDRVHLLICPPALGSAQADRWFAAAAAVEPAGAVTSVSARGWSSLTLPGADGQRCPQLSGPVTADHGVLGDALAASLAASPVTVVYPLDDPAARDLAVRLASLMGLEARAVPLTPAAAVAAVRRGEACASVMPQFQSYANGCLQMAALLGRAAWLQRAGLVDPASSVEEALTGAAVATPLAVTRAWLATRDDLGGITLHYDACPDLAGLGRLAAAANP